MAFSKSTLLALLPFFLAATPALAATGKTTRYWDCCKPSCSWDGKATLATGPVATCDKNDSPLADPNAVSACDGGSAYMCSNESPWAVSDDLAYGFAAVSISGGSESSWCCACYELTFTSGPVQGKKMIVQATNTGGDLGSNHFDISIPGGGFGIFNGCTPQYGTPSTGWGEQYGGVSSRSMCDAFPEKLKAGCYWRYDWFGNSDNPSVSFEPVACPKALVAKSGCARADDSPVGEVQTPTLGPDVGEAKPSSSSVKAEAPKSSAAKAEPTVVVPPKVDEPVVDEPAVSTSAAPSSTAAASSAAAPVVNKPVASAPAVEEPVVSVSVVASSSAAAPAKSSASSIAQAPPAVTSAAPVSSAPAVGSVVLPGSTVTESVAWCGGPANTGVVAKYGQCGGKMHTGATVCAEGSTCKVSNEYYSQCV